MIKPDKKNLTPGIIGFLPLFYVGWSDSVLSPSEIRLIHKKINDFPFLTKDEKAYLIHWSDPKNPPDAHQFRIWRSAIRDYTHDFSMTDKTTIVDMGLMMANKIQRHADGHDWGNRETKAALEDISYSLGLSQESLNAFTTLIGGPGQLPAFCRECSFDHREMSLVLDGSYREIKNKMRTLLADPMFAIRHFPLKEDHRQHVLEQVKTLANQGLSAYAFPEKYGGFEKAGHHIAIFEMLGFTDLSLTIKFGVQFGLFGNAIYMLGTEKHHRKYLEAMHKAELLGCFAMTETGHGSDVKNLETTATYDHADRRVLIQSPDEQSGKEYIGNALHASMAAVFAQFYVGDVNHGVHCFLVPLRDSSGLLLEGIRIEDCGYKMGLNGVDNGRIWFDKVRIPVENLLDKYASIGSDGKYNSSIKNDSKRFFTMLGALVVGRISVGLIGISASKTALTIALRYSLERRQFEKGRTGEETPIIDYPSHQKRLIPLLARVYAYHFGLQNLAEHYTAGTKETREIETLAAGLKAKATWLTTAVIQECREACGGKGYLHENRFADLKNDTDVFTTFEGDNTVLMQLVAKGLMTDFKQSFHDDGYRAVLQILLTRVKHELHENNPFSKRNTDTTHLLSTEFYRHAFQYRKNKSLIALGLRMRKYLKRGMDPYQAFLRVQIHMIDLADAFVDSIVLEAFVNAIDQTMDPKCKDALRRLLSIYALSTIEENKGWYLENDYMDGSKTKAIRRLISKKLLDAKQDLKAYIDAFEIPGQLINAPIAHL